MIFIYMALRDRRAYSRAIKRGYGASLRMASSECEMGRAGTVYTVKLIFKNCLSWSWHSSVDLLQLKQDFARAFYPIDSWEVSQDKIRVVIPPKNKGPIQVFLTTPGTLPAHLIHSQSHLFQLRSYELEIKSSS
ncbi:MAG: hypothetical protein HQ530_01550 [Parcubacteria group bacterium]|nr:hypothetical protein [Parcubacteria group bacterium]